MAEVTEDSDDLMASADEHLPIIPEGVSRRSALQVITTIGILSVCMLATTTAYSFAAFMTYLNDVKKYFLLSQSGVELLLGVNWLGLLMALPAGLFLEKFGVRACAFVAVVISVVGNYLIYYACTNKDVFSDSTTYLTVIFFVAGIGTMLDLLVAGCGSGVTYLTALTAAARQVSAKHRGAVLSMVSAGSSLGPMLFIVFYDNWFYDNRDLPGYFLLVTVIFGVINLLGMIVYGFEMDSQEETLGESIMLRSSMEALPTYGNFEPSPSSSSGGQSVLKGSQVLEETTSESDATDMTTVWDFVTSPNFHALFWPSIINMGIVIVNINNISTFLAAAMMDELSTTVPLIPACIGLFGKFSIGFISDSVLDYMPRAWFLFIASVLGAISYMLAAFFIGNLAMLVTNLVVSEIAYSIVIGLMPTVFSEEFGMEAFPTCWGLVVAGISVSGFFLAQAFGWLYEASIEEEESLECFGTGCFSWSFIGASLLAVFSAILTLFYLFNKEQIYICCCKDAALEKPKDSRASLEAG